MPSDLISIEALKAELCAIDDLDTRNERCRVLYSENMPAELRALLLHFWADGLGRTGDPFRALKLLDKGLTVAAGERRAHMLVLKANNLYESGGIQFIPSCLDELNQLPDVPANVAAYGLALSAIAEGLGGRPDWWEAFEEAEAALAALPGQEWNVGWIQDSASTLALTLDQPDRAITWAERVTHSDWEQGARLLLAEAQAVQGEWHLALEILVESDGYTHTPLNQARRHYLRAMRAVHDGDLLAADRHLCEASVIPSQPHLMQPSIGLFERIGKLRKRLHREGGRG